MIGFELDTSGAIDTSLAPITVGDAALSSITWDDLSDFAKDYVEALFDYEMVTGNAFGGAVVGFDDLSSSAIASIIADCATSALGYTDGSAFLTDRQAGKFWPVFPPVTPYIGDDGSIYLLASV